MKIRRWIRRIALTVGVLIVLLLLAVAVLMTVDLGPVARERAEQQGSKLINRPMHIGRLGIRLRSGNFVIEDFRIDGLTPADPPFFRAKRIEVSLYWWTFFGTPRDLLIKSVDMSDWDMQVEMKDGHHNFIDTDKFKSKPGAPKRSFTVTVARVDAVRGRFSYIDHGTWSTVSPNLTVHVDHDTGEYRGRAAFSDGTVKIKSYEAMRDDMRCAFQLDGGKVHLNWIDLTTDGSHSVVTGDVDFGNWPEMLYRVRTDMVNFPRMRQIFFADEKFRVGGEGRFNGTFHLYKGGGRDLQGSFSSPLLTIDNYRFPDLTGELRWLPDRFTVTHGAAKFHGGTGHFTYSMAPLGAPRPAIARFETTYTNVDLASFTDYLQTQGLRIAGRATGRNVLEWPLGRFSEHRGEGQVVVTAPADTQLYSRTSAPLPQQQAPGTGGGLAVGGVPNLGYVPMAGTLTYQFGPEWIEVGPSSVATPATYVEFGGRTAYGDRSSIDFFARSGDWQESDKLLAAVITAFGSKTRTISVGGYGEFTGRMVNSFRRPRIEGAFTGEQVHAFDVIWGAARGKVIVDNGYVEVTDGIVTKGPSELRAEGRFSLSTPREDGGEEINTRVTLKDWPIADLRHAFDLDDYPINGRTSGQYQVHGAYRRPYGDGRMIVDDAIAYGEPIEHGAGDLALEGMGVRLKGIQLAKGGGTIRGGAYVSWDGRYSFDALAERIPVEQIAALKFPAINLSGVVRFSASGSATFANPYYEVNDIRIADLYVGDEGIGQVVGKMSVENRLLAFNVDAGSTRLTVSGAGRISMTPGYDCEMSFLVTNTSLDPYLRALQPGSVSPFTSAIASGTVHAKGLLADPSHLSAEAKVDQLDMRLFDYTITNAKGLPLQVAFGNNVIHLGDAAAPGATAAVVPAALVPQPGRGRAARPPLVLVGQDTRLVLSGDVNLGNEPYVQTSGALVPGQSLRVHADGDANLGILQGLFADIRSSGSARLSADVQGPLRDIAFTGQATVADGRIRYYSLPRAIEAINGPITFTAGAVWLGDPKNPKNELTARVGGGAVAFGGRIYLNGFTPTQWAVTANGTDVHLRYPEGFNSVIRGDLELTGPYAAPTLRGLVTVDSGVYSKALEISPALAFAAAANAPTAAAGASSAFPLRFNIRILAPSTLRIENNLARELVANADLTLQGTYDRPRLLGTAEIERGYLLFEGKRYTVTQGVVQFSDPLRIDPHFDFEFETRVRVPGQSYFVNVRAVGTMKKFDLPLSSDPPLPEPEIASLLLGDIRNPEDVRNAELLQLQRPNAATEDVLRTRLEQILLSPATNVLSNAFERAFALSTFQLTPSLFDAYQRLNPTARLTIAKQISSRAYLTVSRSVYAPQEDIIYILEYDQSDRISWVLSRNEDRTYALDVRVRHVF